MGPDFAEATERAARESMSQTQVQSSCFATAAHSADGLLWEAAEQIGQMRAASLSSTLTLLVTDLVLVVCCARSVQVQNHIGVLTP